MCPTSAAAHVAHPQMFSLHDVTWKEVWVDTCKSFILLACEAYDHSGMDHRKTDAVGPTKESSPSILLLNYFEPGAFNLQKFAFNSGRCS